MVNNGLGANAEVYLNNKGSLNESFAKSVMNFFGYIEGFDFQIEDNLVAVGREPTYQYDALEIIKIVKNKEDSTYTTGKSFGPYGSGVRSRTRRLGDYKRKSKFVQFVDAWHPILFNKE
jgi:hypothetical protein